MLRQWTVPFAVLISCAGLASPDLALPAEDGDSALVRVVTKDKKAVVGQLLRETDAGIELVELTTSEAKVIPADQIDHKVRITESQAASFIGLGNVLAWKIQGAIPKGAPSGRVVKVDQAAIYVSLGGKSGAKAGQEMRVYRGETELKDPATGDVLGRERRLIARLIVTEVSEKFSKARMQGDLEIALEVGDTVEPTGANNVVVVLPFVTVNGERTTAGRDLAEQLTTALVQRKVNVVERSQVDRVLAELLMQNTVLFDPEKAQRIGKQVGAYATLLGTLSFTKNAAQANVRLVEIETGRILTAGEYRLPGKAPAAGAPREAAPQVIAQSGGGITNSIGMKMVLIPPGEFTMGSSEGYSNEKPPHKVRITNLFYLGMYPVTQDEYKRVMRVNPSAFSANQIRVSTFNPQYRNGEQGEKKMRASMARAAAGKITGSCPVETVAWVDCVEFCRRLSAMPAERAAGRVYRLPREAEWEYACRAGTTTRWYCGDDVADLTNCAWFNENSGDTSHPVGQKKPNAWGLYDMHGLVWQWCSDWFGGYHDSPATDPTGPERGDMRVCRGGACYSRAILLRSASRKGYPPSSVSCGTGFRMAVEIAGQER
jgi:formylglycine-generating enzyme required for sulfatase activity